MNAWTDISRSIDRNTVKVALKVALLIGTLLNLINHYDLLLGAPASGAVLAQVAMTYLVPFCVSTHGQVSARRALARAPRP